MADDTDVIPSQEAARLLGVTRSGLTRMVERGNLTPAIRMPGRTGAFLFSRGDIEALMRAREERSRPDAAVETAS